MFKGILGDTSLAKPPLFGVSRPAGAGSHINLARYMLWSDFFRGGAQKFFKFADVSTPGSLLPGKFRIELVQLVIWKSGNDRLTKISQHTLQGTKNISHPWEPENHLQAFDFSGDMLVPRRGKSIQLTAAFAMLTPEVRSSLLLVGFPEMAHASTQWYADHRYPWQQRANLPWPENELLEYHFWGSMANQQPLDIERVYIECHLIWFKYRYNIMCLYIYKYV